MDPDFLDLLRAFVAADVRFLIVGAYALAHHGHPRATGELDIWVEATPVSPPRVMRALASFGAPTEDISLDDFARQGAVFQIGVAPGRIDILTELTALTFAEAWPTREQARDWSREGPRRHRELVVRAARQSVLVPAPVASRPSFRNTRLHSRIWQGMVCLNRGTKRRFSTRFTLAHGAIEWPSGLDLCADAMYLRLTGKSAEEVFPDMKLVSADA